MRKAVSFVIVMFMVMGSFGMALAAPLSDMTGQKSEDAVKVLTEFGVVKGYPDGTFKPGNIVTRGEMAVIIVSALGLANNATGTANFSDMSGHWSNGFVGYAAGLGIIAGYPDGTFKPDKTVSYDEATTMLIAALGYNASSLAGVWPSNYVTKARDLGILEGIRSGAAGANRGDIAIMVFQALDQAVGKTENGVWRAYEKDSMRIRLEAKSAGGEGIRDVATRGYAIILELKSARKAALPGGNALIKLFLADGTAKVFEVDTDIPLYDESDWESGYAGGRAIEYGVDKDGVVNMIETLHMSFGEEEKITEEGYFDGKPISSDVLIFTFEEIVRTTWDYDKMANENLYGVVTLDEVKGGKYNVFYLQDSGKIVLMYIWGEDRA